MAVKITKLRDGVLIAKRAVIHLSHDEAAQVGEALSQPKPKGQRT